MSHANWSRIHSPERSWRGRLTGSLNESFIIPRYVEFFYESLKGRTNLSLVEIGAGNGDLTKAILAADHGTIGRYLVTEQDRKCVDWLRSSGLEAAEADGMALPYPDSSFDVCVEFDVLHHVSSPRRMAGEMMRVARGTCLLVESNGLSVFRKLRELTPGHRRAGERSFTPAGWRGFFEGHPGLRVTRFEVFPFLFPIPSPRALMPAVAAWNRLIEKTPFFRWQCSSVAIVLEYTR